MTTKEQYHHAYQVLRSLQSHGWKASYWGDTFLLGEIDPRIIGLAAISLAAYCQDDPLDKPFHYRCQVARKRWVNGEWKWIYVPEGAGIPF